MKKAIVIGLLVWFLIAPAYAGTQNRVFFDRGACDPAVELIINARDSIHIQMYGMTNFTPIIEALKTARSNGVKTIQILIDNQGFNNPEKRNEKGGLTGFPEKDLEVLGIEVKWEYTSRTMHRKVTLVDMKTVFIGSTNWTKNGFDGNMEIDVAIEDPMLAEVIYNQFDEDFKKANPNYPAKEQNEKDDEECETCKESAFQYLLSLDTSDVYHKQCCYHIKNKKPERLKSFETEEEAKEGNIRKRCKDCFEEAGNP